MKEMTKRREKQIWEAIEEAGHYDYDEGNIIVMYDESGNGGDIIGGYGTPNGRFVGDEVIGRWWWKTDSKIAIEIELD